MHSAFDVQRALVARGFDIGPAGADGDIGPSTLSAMMKALERIPVVSTIPVLAEPDKRAMAMVAPPTVPSKDQPKAPPNAIVIGKASRDIHEIIWHCTATPEGKDYTVDDIRAWHKQRGFSDIGYHFVVYRDGRVMIGRPLDQVGAHCSGQNTGSIGCSYVGGVTADGKTAKDTRTPAQRSSMLWLTRELCSRFKIKKVTGHNFYANKACPSFDVRKDPLGQM